MNANTAWNLVDEYITERLIPQDPILEQVLEANREADLPPIDVAPNQGKLLQLIARMTNAKRILEIGTLGGYSTIWMGRALPAEGRLITLELEPKHAEVAQANVDLAGLTHRVEIRSGNALEQLAKLEQEGTESFDLIFIDADKPSNPAYLQWALRFSHPGTVIIGDNVVREGEVVSRHSTDPRVQGVRAFYDLLAKEPRISATAIQTVGGKGYDGFMIGIVNG
ncbi:O-methyltransferase [Paenibacillus sacheonensis]|uniref:Methyltransferase n=1 Tax=Paenibacillus sacheonensis TaxID=742054 RepID=A0A7X4YJX2_9BACL|nr:O-methyltransferase [Paenibacillus sacheonensis]MBM7563969.1 putative O-methyltransferase YrrM [Paenibacillus sacheonensis]NBC67690.1 methyltransferase [Paenibacillus sacheonensis]